MRGCSERSVGVAEGRTFLAQTCVCVVQSRTHCEQLGEELKAALADARSKQSELDGLRSKACAPHARTHAHQHHVKSGGDRTAPHRTARFGLQTGWMDVG